MRERNMRPKNIQPYNKVRLNQIPLKPFCQKSHVDNASYKLQLAKDNLTEQQSKFRIEFGNPCITIFYLRLDPSD